MSFVKTLPESMTHAAGQLAGIGEALSAESGAVAIPTTVIAPAGTDPVSALQAAVFATYGSLYQSISEQATAVHQQLVQVLGQNAGAYSTAEATNQATSSMDSGLQWFLTNILGVPTSGSGSLLSGNLANIENIGMGNWASATSALLGLAGGGLLDFPEEIAAEGAAGLMGYEAPAAMAGVGAMPVAAGMAQATTVGSLSAPPSWGAEPVAAASAAPARLAAASSMATPHSVPTMAAVPAAMAAAGAGDRGVGKFGAPRYGVKHTVMPKPTAV
ncbi:PE family protein [Mycobacterium sp. SMC-19]|uniref:PE family protein n=1 Tax=Mycobacterium sp. SMC-19 TaxID=3381630 RepID=UPI003876B20A